MASLSTPQLIIWCISLLLPCTLTAAQVCRQSPCEYTLTIRHDRTMLYRPRATPGTAYKVGLNGTRLQVVETAFLKQDHDRFGEFVDDVDDVITADGVTRTILTVNGQFPGPPIEVEEGVQVVVKVENKLRTDGVSVHWHGIYHKGDMWMDGAAQITQCPIAPFQSFTYRFKASPVGTHWYHAHNGLQRIDGLSGMFIIHPKGVPTMENSFNLMVADWMHEEGNTLEITNPFSQDKGDKGAGEHLHTHPSIREYGVDGVENAGMAYTSGLINGRGRFSAGKQLPLTRFRVDSGKTYRFRSVNTGGEFPYAVSVDGHRLRIVALDGTNIAPYVVDDVVLAPGEAVDFEIMANQTAMLYWLRARTLRDSRVDGVIREVLAVVEYSGTGQTGDPTTQPRSCSAQNLCKTLNCPFENYPPGMNQQCVSISQMRSAISYSSEYGLDTKEEDVLELFLNAGFSWGSSINGRKFVQPNAPLYQQNRKVIDCAEVCKDQTLGCVCTGTYSLPVGKTIQLVLSNVQEGEPLVAHHPMHLHGHNLAILKIGYGTYNSTGHHLGQTPDIQCANPVCRSPTWSSSSPVLNLERPPLKNTIMVPARGYVVVRFKADNPGRWLFHCHAVTHNVEGMVALIEEGSEDLLPPVPDNFPTCLSFDWTQEEYEMYKKGDEDKDEDGENGDNKDKMSEGKDGLIIRTKDDNMLMINMYTFAGVIVAGVVLGVLLACLVFCFVFCARRCTHNKVSHTKM